jgi:hypothetical protein
MLKWVTVFALVTAAPLALADEVKIANIEYPSHLYGERGVVVTVESAKNKVECVAYRDGVPVGSGSGYTTARIANVTVLITERKGALTVKCM